MPTAFLQHRFEADGMLAQYARNGCQDAWLINNLKAQIVLADHILDALVRHILQAVVLIRLWGHAAAAVFQDITRHIDDIPHYGTAANQHIAAYDIASDRDGIVDPINIGQPALYRHQGRVDADIQPSLSHLG